MEVRLKREAEEEGFQLPTLSMWRLPEGAQEGWNIICKLEGSRGDDGEIYRVETRASLACCVK